MLSNKCRLKIPIYSDRGYINTLLSKGKRERSLSRFSMREPGIDSYTNGT